jgi:hypothetical protein
LASWLPATRPGDPVPTLLSARPPQDPAEERAVRKLATSRHAPGDWIARARMISRSWTARAPARSPPSSTATPRPCTSASSGSTPRGWTGLVTAPVPAASRGSPSTSAASSSPWSSSYRRGGCAARPTGACTPTSPIRRPTGPWTPSPRPRRPGARHPGAAQPGPPQPAGRGSPLAPVALLDPVQRPGVRRKRTAIVALYTHPPARARSPMVVQ